MHSRAFCRALILSVFLTLATTIGFASSAMAIGENSDFRISATRNSTAEVNSGNSVSYNLAATNHGPDSTSIDKFGILVISPVDTNYVNASVVSGSNLSLSCNDMGLASSLPLTQINSHSGHYIYCLVDLSDDQFAISESVTITLNFLATSKFQNNIQKLYALVFVDDINDPGLVAVEGALDVSSSSSPFLLTGNNNVTSVGYSFVAPTATTVKPSNATTSTTRATTTTSVAVEASETTTTSKNSGSSSGEVETKVKGKEIEKSDPFLVLGAFSVTGSNVLDLIILALIIGASGWGIHKLSKRRKGNNIAA